jgi:hypothetical protein
VPALTDHYVAGTWRDLGWMFSYLCAGTAALHPSMRVFVSSRPVLMPTRRLALLGLSLVTVALAEGVEYAVNGRASVYPFAIAGAVFTVRLPLAVPAMLLTD